MKPAIAQVCSLPAPLARQVEDYAAGQCRALEIWLTKLEEYLRHHSLDEVRQLMARNGMAMPVASFQGGLLLSSGLLRDEAWDLFARRLELCRELGIATLVVAPDASGSATEADFERLHRSLGEAAELAASRQVRIAVEFQAKAPLLNNLQTAVAVVEAIGHPALGICFDAFHFAVGPSKYEDLGCLAAEHLFHVQLCDLSEMPRELATDSYRILPGDGDLPLALVVERLRQIGYDGYVSVELMNHQLWQVATRTFGEIAMTSLRCILGQASMGESSPVI
jgi:sugar phosphate isomerase/epimerase